jgi:hypothetical protein
MVNKDRKARITYWEDDGAYIDVAYYQENGERVEACFKRQGWQRPPKRLLEHFYEAMEQGPTTFHGKRG